MHDYELYITSPKAPKETLDYFLSECLKMDKPEISVMPGKRPSLDIAHAKKYKSFHAYSRVPRDIFGEASLDMKPTILLSFRLKADGSGYEDRERTSAEIFTGIIQIILTTDWDFVYNRGLNMVAIARINEKILVKEQQEPYIENLLKQADIKYETISWQRLF